MLRNHAFRPTFASIQVQEGSWPISGNDSSIVSWKELLDERGGAKHNMVDRTGSLSGQELTSLGHLPGAGDGRSRWVRSADRYKVEALFRSRHVDPLFGYPRGPFGARRTRRKALTALLADSLGSASGGKHEPTLALHTSRELLEDEVDPISSCHSGLLPEKGGTPSARDTCHLAPHGTLCTGGWQE